MATDTRTSTQTTAAPEPPAIRLDAVSVRLGDRLALHDIDLSIASGSFVGLIGPNGSGKSTLLRSVLGILPLARGSVEVDGRPPGEARDLLAYLPQRQQIEMDLPLRAWDVVMMGRLRHTGWLRPSSRHDKEVVAWALERVGLVDRRYSSIGEMSFGQQQRVFFARSLAQEGRIILLDEPMNGVDSQTEALFTELLTFFHGEGKTLVMATHDLNQAAAICDNVCILNQSLVAYGPVEQTLTEDVLQRAFGLHLHFVHGEGDAPSHVDHVLEDVHHHDTHSEGRRRGRLG